MKRICCVFSEYACEGYTKFFFSQFNNSTYYVEGFLGLFFCLKQYLAFYFGVLFTGEQPPTRPVYDSTSQGSWTTTYSHWVKMNEITL